MVWFVITIIVIILFLVVYVRGFLSSHITTPGQVKLYFANIGSGKSILLALIAEKEVERLNKGKSPYKHIVSNTHIKGVRYVPNIRELLKLGMLENTLILADEGSIEWDNRSMNMTLLERAEFKLIRHYKSSLIVVSQDYQNIDIEIRRLYTSIYLLRTMGNFSYTKQIYKRIDITEDEQIGEMYTFAFWPLNNQYYYKPRYYHLFDSYNQPEYIPKIDLEKNIVVYSNGDTKELTKRDRTEMLKGTEGMTLYDKLLCNRNMQKLLESKLFKFHKGELMLKEDAEDFLTEDYWGLVKESEEKANRSKMNSAKRAKKKVHRLTRANDWDMFVTFTLDPELVDRKNYDECAKVLGKWIDKTRKLYPGFRWCLVPERHKDGAWHYHGMFKGFPLQLLDYSGYCYNEKSKRNNKQDNIFKVGERKPIYNISNYEGGFTTLTMVENIKATRNYILKYFTKDMAFGVQPNKKRYWASRKLIKPDIFRFDYTPEQLKTFLESIKDDILFTKEQVIDTKDYTNNITYYELKEKTLD